VPNLSSKKFSFKKLRIENPSNTPAKTHTKKMSQPAIQQVTILEKIGEGLFGTVNKARYGSIEEFVAVKMIPKIRFRQSPSLQKMIANEIEVGKKFKHPNMVNLIDNFDTKKEINMIYEFCNQGPLSAIIKKREIFRENEAIVIVYQLVLALSELLKNGIVHRDIKPENILLKDCVVKLADFGLCMVGRPVPADRNMIGSMLFMAPESFTNFIYTHKSDIYALGLVL
jgi:serine/threonine protein kinase